tara:strand:+ start:677 stop:1756 length:1080 start_codon:yes stop_codon:yes gene_type:complete
MGRKRFSKIIIINLGIMSVLVLLVELMLGAWIFPANGLKFHGVLPNMDEQFEVSMFTETPITINHTRDWYGLRGLSTFNQPQKIDILTVGGSTTFQKYIDDKDTWQEHLEAKLRTAEKGLTVSNAGLNGHSTYAHIKSFDTWFSTIQGLKPSFILFYIGVNDFLPRSILMEEDGGGSWLKSTLQDNSIVYNTMRRIKGALMAKEIGFENLMVDFSKYEYTTDSLLTKEYHEFYLDEFVPAFKSRVQKLIDLSVDMGAEPVFITQPMLFYRLKDGILSGVDFARHDFVTGQAVNGVDSYNMITHLNDAIREVCGQKYRVVELTSLPVWEQEDFHDWIHNTPLGAKKVADEIWKQLGDYLK